MSRRRPMPPLPSSPRLPRAGEPWHAGHMSKPTPCPCAPRVPSTGTARGKTVCSHGGAGTCDEKESGAISNLESVTNTGHGKRFDSSESSPSFLNVNGGSHAERESPLLSHATPSRGPRPESPSAPSTVLQSPVARWRVSAQPRVATSGARGGDRWLCVLPRWQLNVNVNWPTLLKELTGLCVLPRWRMNVNVNSLGSDHGSDSPPLWGVLVQGVPSSV